MRLKDLFDDLIDISLNSYEEHTKYLIDNLITELIFNTINCNVEWDMNKEFFNYFFSDEGVAVCKQISEGVSVSDAVKNVDVQYTIFNHQDFIIAVENWLSSFFAYQNCNEKKFGEWVESLQQLKKEYDED